MKTSFLHFTSILGTALAGLVLANATQAADSAKLFWAVNSHYYQRFEHGNMVWADAKKACEGLSAHLATITSANEQVFIETHLLTGVANPARSDYFIGGMQAAQNLNWKWITGEVWSYEKWLPGEPSSEGYLLINPNPNYYFGTWWDAGSTYFGQGYICEWGNNNSIGTAVVPDLNNNDVDEIAILWVDYKTGKHTVQIKDPKTNRVLNTLTFATDFAPPQGMVVLNDLNGNGTPEIGVLYLSSVKVPTVQIKDAMNNAITLKTMSFLDQNYAPRAITASPDSNHNGSSEITVLGRQNTTAKDVARMRDSKTEDILYTVGF
jgi:hypothetical protein